MFIFLLNFTVFKLGTNYEVDQLTEIRGCVLRKQLHNLFIVHSGVGGCRARELYLLFEEG